MNTNDSTLPVNFNLASRLEDIHTDLETWRFLMDATVESMSVPMLPSWVEVDAVTCLRRNMDAVIFLLRNLETIEENLASARDTAYEISGSQKKAISLTN